MKFAFRLALLLLPFTCISTVAAAELRFAGIFADHAVLQREHPVEIWGWGQKGVSVKVTFGEQSIDAIANDQEIWSVTLKPMKANAVGKSLKVTSGESAVVVRDVVVGEVWHASGQSNMAMSIAAMAKELEVVKKDIAAADLPMIRFCRINAAESATPLSDLRDSAQWSVCSRLTVSRFSGVAFYFARELQGELGVPVGVINTSRGGTPIEPFIPQAAFQSHATLRRELELGDQNDLEAIWKLPGGVRARDANWLPGRLFHSRLAPVARYAVRGAIWYQGESNCGDREDPRDYQHKMRALINGWRTAFVNETLPIYFVQLPGSGAGRGWPYLREQQRLASDLANTGMVVTIDIPGKGIHPANKIDVGKRLAKWALANDYKKVVPFSGPMFVRQEIQKDQLVLHFRHTDGGLMSATKEGLAEPMETPETPLAHFEIAYQAGSWKPASATIAGETIVVASRDSRAPLAVRYAYAVTPEQCNLYNRAGLPASPFCTRPELLKYDPELPR